MTCTLCAGFISLTRKKGIREKLGKKKIEPKKGKKQQADAYLNKRRTSLPLAREKKRRQGASKE